MSAIKRFCRYFVIQYYLKMAAAQIAVSERTAQLLGFPECLVVPSPVDIEEFPEEATISAHDDPKCIAFMGRLSWIKGCDHVLRVLAALRDRSTELHVYGEGPYQPQLARLAEDLGVARRVVFHGFVQGAALNAAYRRARCVLVPSRWEEPFCMVAPEAMYCGTPVIGSDHGGLPTAIGPGGVVHPLSDLCSWVKDTERILESDEFHAHLAAAGRRYVIENFAKEVVAKRFDRILRAVMDGARGRDLPFRSRAATIEHA